MTLIEFENELSKVGNNTDNVIFFSDFFPGGHYINDIIFENGFLYLKENLNCMDEFYTCGKLFYHFDNLFLDDNTEVRFVFTNDCNNRE